MIAVTLLCVLSTSILDSIEAPEAFSRAGEPLLRSTLPTGNVGQLQANLDAAIEARKEKPEDPLSVIWHGRRLAYLGEYRRAIAVFSEGLRQHPQEPRLLRHRGHRFISIRRFDLAVGDLSRASRLIVGRADAIEPDGAPNAAGIPVGTTHFNIWYHLALALFLQGDFKQAKTAWESCLEVSKSNDDKLVATSHWLYMTYRRLGLEESAKRLLTLSEGELTILENDGYRDLLDLYRGRLQPEALWNPDKDDALQSATKGFGVGHWYLVQGQAERAEEIFERVCQGAHWATFGFIAAEAELARR